MREPGGDPKSSLGGPRTAREVAGYNINHSRSACRASCSKRACAFAIGAGSPGRRSASYIAKPSCLRFNRILRAGSNASHAGLTVSAFIAIPLEVLVAKARSPEVFRLSGLRGGILAAMIEGYPVVLPESGRSLPTRMAACTKQVAHAEARRVG